MIDFCDAACEWGSIVPIPAREADRMIVLAEQRRIAALGTREAPQNDGHHSGVSSYNTTTSLRALIAVRNDGGDSAATMLRAPKCLSSRQSSEYRVGVQLVSIGCREN
jgi:hypothetical protein